MGYNEIKHILPAFDFQGRFVRVDEMTSGNINATYHLVYRRDAGLSAEYTLQQINHNVFKEPASVMRNIEQVTRHLRERYLRDGLDPSRRTLELIPTRAGDTMYGNDKVGYWRAYRFIDNVNVYDRIEKPAHFKEAGRAFGRFQKLLHDFPVENLAEIIPDFHNTQKRFYAFVAAVERDGASRVRDVKPEIEFFLARWRIMGEIVERIADGTLPLRVTHNDTKINNVMIDGETDEAVCVIDLDTVMPGSSLYDFGDAIRSGASTADEDEEDAGKIALDIDRFRLFSEGFLSETCGFLARDEILLLPLGAVVITCELAMRFLTDYLDGDQYFKINSPEHNLIRARAQMKLLTDIEAKFEEMNRIVEGMIP